MSLGRWDSNADFENGFESVRELWFIVVEDKTTHSHCLLPVLHYVSGKEVQGEDHQ